MIDNLIRTALMQIPGRLVPRLAGPDYPEAFGKVEDFVHDLPNEIYQAAPSAR